MSQQNVEIAQRAYDWLASVNNDADHAAAFVADFCDPDAEIVPPAIYPDGERSYRGVAGRLRWQGLLNEIWHDFRFEGERFLDAGDQVVVYALISGTGKQSGATRTISIAASTLVTVTASARACSSPHLASNSRFSALPQ
jgi:ketosteroid isomerase-like protein